MQESRVFIHHGIISFPFINFPQNDFHGRSLLKIRNDNWTWFSSESFFSAKIFRFNKSLGIKWIHSLQEPRIYSHIGEGGIAEHSSLSSFPLMHYKSAQSIFMSFTVTSLFFFCLPQSGREFRLKTWVGNNHCSWLVVSTLFKRGSQLNHKKLSPVNVKYFVKNFPLSAGRQKCQRFDKLKKLTSLWHRKIFISNGGRSLAGWKVELSFCSSCAYVIQASWKRLKKVTQWRTLLAYHFYETVWWLRNSQNKNWEETKSWTFSDFGTCVKRWIHIKKFSKHP